MTGTKLLTFMPYAPDMNLGRAYNECMEEVRDDSTWVCFLDHDMMLTTRTWYHQLLEAIEAVPDAGLFTAVANRIGAAWQRPAGDKLREVHDVPQHRKFGDERLKVRTLLDITDTKGFGGVLMCLQKSTWRQVGGFVDGMLCVDHGMHFAIRDAGKRVFLIEGLYVYHWRRAFGDKLPDHTPRAANCQCRGLEQQPTVRLRLPARTA